MQLKSHRKEMREIRMQTMTENVSSYLPWALAIKCIRIMTRMWLSIAYFNNHRKIFLSSYYHHGHIRNQELYKVLNVEYILYVLVGKLYVECDLHIASLKKLKEYVGLKKCISRIWREWNCEKMWLNSPRRLTKCRWENIRRE